MQTEQALINMNVFQPQQTRIGELSEMFNAKILPLAEEMEVTEGEQLLNQVRGDIGGQRQAQDEAVLFQNQQQANIFENNNVANDPLPEFASIDADVPDAPEIVEVGNGSRGNFSPEDFTFQREARIKNGKLKVYKPPSGDGGGSFEVAGITARYQPKESARLKRLIEQGRNGQAIKEAKEFYRKRGAPFTKHASQKGLQLQLSDSVHHRGEGGLKRILQRATGTKGKSTASMIRALDSSPSALSRFNRARVDYELKEVDRGRSSRVKFRQGLLNRFKQAHQAALKANQS